LFYILIFVQRCLRPEPLQLSYKGNYLSTRAFHL